jgi:hypothetical protein
MKCHNDSMQKNTLSNVISIGIDTTIGKQNEDYLHWG